MSLNEKHSPEAARELVELYLLGSLPGLEAAAFEAHLSDGCPHCEHELGALRGVIGLAGLDARPQEPPANLKQRLLERIGVGSQAPSRKAPGVALDRNGIHVIRAGEVPWVRAPFPGVHVKRLHSDPQTRTVTQLVRLEAGARYPSHRHASNEEIWMLEGEIEAEGVKVHAGDYCLAGPGSVHGELSSEHGALFLVKSSRDDEILG